MASGALTYVRATDTLCHNPNMPAVYDKFARNYDRAFAPLEWLGLRRWRQEVISLLPVNADILEIGCGAGANFEFYPQCKLAVSSELSIGTLGRPIVSARRNRPMIATRKRAIRMPPMMRNILVPLEVAISY